MRHAQTLLVVLASMRVSSWLVLYFFVEVFQRCAVSQDNKLILCELTGEAEGCAFYLSDDSTEWSQCDGQQQMRNVTAGICSNSQSNQICDDCAQLILFGALDTCWFGRDDIISDGEREVVEEKQNCSVAPPPSPPPAIPPPSSSPLPPPSPVQNPLKSWSVCGESYPFLQIRIETLGITLRELNDQGDFLLSTFANMTNTYACFEDVPTERSPGTTLLLRFSLRLTGYTSEQAAALKTWLEDLENAQELRDRLRLNLNRLEHISVLEVNQISLDYQNEVSDPSNDAVLEQNTTARSNDSILVTLLVVLLPVCGVLVVLIAAAAYTWRKRRNNEREIHKSQQRDVEGKMGPDPIMFTTYSDNPVHFHEGRDSTISESDRDSFLKKFKNRFLEKKSVVPEEWHQNCVEDISMRLNVGLQALNDALSNMFMTIEDDLRDNLVRSVKKIGIQIGEVVSFMQNNLILIVPGQDRLPRHKRDKLKTQYRRLREACRSTLHDIEDKALEQCVSLVYHSDLVGGISILKEALDSYDRALQHSKR